MTHLMYRAGFVLLGVAALSTSVLAAPATGSPLPATPLVGAAFTSAPVTSAPLTSTSLATATYDPGLLYYPALAVSADTKVVKVAAHKGDAGDQCSSYDNSVCKINLQAGQDADIQLPRNSKRYGGISITGGHNIRIIGGYLTIPAALVPDDNPNNYERTMINIKQVTGTVHIEGVRIDASGTCAPELVCGPAFDAIKLASPNAVVEIVNTRIMDPTTTRTAGKTLHSDGIQAAGGVRSLRLDRVTMRSKFNNMQLRQEDNGTLREPIGPMYFRRTDIQIMPDTAATAFSIGLGPGRPSACGSPVPQDEADGCAVSNDIDPDNCRPGTGVGPGADAWGVTFDRVYVNQPAGRAVNDLVQPGSNSHCPSAAVNGQLHWSNWESGTDPKEVGRITLGVPPNGDFAPGCINGTGNTACPGLNYTSPGYSR